MVIANVPATENRTVTLLNMKQQNRDRPLSGGVSGKKQELFHNGYLHEEHPRRFHHVYHHIKVEYSGITSIGQFMQSILRTNEEIVSMHRPQKKPIVRYVCRFKKASSQSGIKAKR